jgi:inorganic pyrophosphatase
MDLAKISSGRNPPKDVHALIEIPFGGVPVKYEMDKASGTLFVDRFLHTAMYYPGNYGFIPHTLSEDGDPIDILVIAPVPVVPGAVVRCRPIGALVMKDQAGPDEKILAVPNHNPRFDQIHTIDQVFAHNLREIEHFFTIYKELEGKRTEMKGWKGPREARDIIRRSRERYQEVHPELKAV